ncbi:MAG: hypothetical protein KGI25_09185 [Thaumarchaeota archaeon]|nr:hypothetical protein [Nitrososphaerota archaeon]
MIAILFTMIFIPNLSAYGHLYGFNVQEWKNPKYNILIQFDIEPQTPSVGKNATLNFSVQNLQTGEHLKNFTETVTIISYNGNLSANNIAYKFASTQEKTGDFSHSYVFTNGGTYEIFLRIDTTTFINVSKFVVFVSSPQFQIMNLVYLLLPFVIVAGAFVGIGIVIWRYIYKKR